jgi:DNA-repair protein XRCC2
VRECAATAHVVVVVVRRRGRRRAMNSLEDALRFLAPDETAREYLDRALAEPMPTSIPWMDDAPEPALRAGELIEIVGGAGSGKTELAIEIAARVVLPRRRDGARYGGSEARVVVIDCDGKFDQLRVLRALNRNITDALVGAKENARERARDEVYEESMSRFTLVRAHSMVDVLKTLTALDAAWGGEVAAAKTDGRFMDAVARGRDGGGEEGGGIGGGTTAGMGSTQRVVICDNVAAFYWLDRASRKDHGAPYNIQRVFTAAARLFKRLSNAHRAAVLVTKSTLAPHRGGEYKDFLPVEWSNAVTQRILLTPSNETVGYGEYAGVATWDVPAKRRGGTFTVTEERLRY